MPDAPLERPGVPPPGGLLMSTVSLDYFGRGLRGTPVRAHSCPRHVWLFSSARCECIARQRQKAFAAPP